MLKRNPYRSPAAAAGAETHAPLEISVSDVSKTYRGRRALDAVSLQIRRGEMVALLGPSGAGKSTLLRQIAGLEASDRGSGEIMMDGHRVQAGGRMSSRIRALRAEMAFIFQQFNLIGRLSLLMNVLAGRLARTPWCRRQLRWFTEEEKQNAMRALHAVGLSEYASQRASTLSGGQQQRGAIARAMVQGARVVLADEPIASLDPESARIVMDGLRELNRQRGVTVVVSVHQIDHARRSCDRIVALRDGQILLDCHVDELDDFKVQMLYGRQEDAERL